MDHLNRNWDKAIELIQEDISPTSFETWIEPLKPVNYDKNHHILTVECSNDLVIRRFNERYAQIFEQAVSTAFGTPVKVEAQVSKPEVRKDNEQKAALDDETLSGENFLNPRFNFDTFVVGKNNEFAFSAAQAVAKAPATQYNPLFIYGGSGLGKTHLMHAIGHYVLQHSHDRKVLYVSSETFTNELISALRHNQMNKFKNKYRRIDVLLIDDIQFIEGKESTQEEFFYTFDALYNNNKQIVISSDRPPQKLKSLDDRLTSRFLWSITADIQPPDYETRVAILTNKARTSNIEITPEVQQVINLIAEKVKSNIREMEGALTRILSFSSLLGTPITVQFARSTLKDLFTEPVSLDLIKSQVCRYYNISVKSMDSPSRSRSIAYPRQIAMYLAKELTDSSYPKIGKAFGNRDHTTALYAYNKISEDLKRNEELKNQIEEIKDLLK